MMHSCSIRLSVPLALAIMTMFSARSLAAEAPNLAGTWRGESVCTTDGTACHNEIVVYYISDLPNQPDHVRIQADKIVNGKPITMGTAEWQYDRVQNALEWRAPRQTWLLKVTGSRIDGTLRLADGTVLRKMRLEKDK